MEPHTHGMTRTKISWRRGWESLLRMLLPAGLALAGSTAMADSAPSRMSEHAPNQALATSLFSWDPYSFPMTDDGVIHWTGLDLNLINAIFKHAGMRYLAEQESNWPTLVTEVENGTKDFAFGSFRTPEREEFAHFSDPYRYENIALYIPRSSVAAFKHDSLAGLFRRLRGRHARLGVVKDWSYSHPVDRHLAQPDNHALLVSFETEDKLPGALLKNEIDAYLCSQITGQTLLWRKGLQSRIQEYPRVLFRSPVHLLFSKETVTQEQVEHINRGLADARQSGEYNQIVRDYMYPILLSITIEARWFTIVDVLGTIAFSISGLLLGRRERYSLFGTFCLAALPAVGGGILRDVLLDRHPLGVLRTPVYMMAVIFTTLSYYFTLHVFRWARIHSTLRTNQALRRLRASTRKITEPLVQTFDAVGLSAFTVIGVVVAVESRVEPLWLWAPFCAALTGAGGGIVRDVVRSDTSLKSLKGVFYPEVALIWGLIFSLYLTSSADRLDPHQIVLAVVIVFLGAFLTRVSAICFKIKSPLF